MRKDSYQTRYPQWGSCKDELPIIVPNVSLFDRNCVLPLNLQRNGFTSEHYPFCDELWEDVAKDFIAYMLVNTPSQKPIIDTTYSYGEIAEYPGLVKEPWRDGSISRSVWFITNDGLSYLDPFLLHWSGVEAIVLTTSGKSDKRFRHSMLQSKQAEIVYNVGITQLETKEWIQHLCRRHTIQNSLIHHLQFSGLRVLMIRHKEDKIRKEGVLPRYILDAIKDEWRSEVWALWQFGECPKAIFDFEQHSAKLTAEMKLRLEREEETDDLDLFSMVAEAYLEPNQPAPEMSRFARIWHDIVGQAIIPFDPRVRRRKLKKAFTILEPYIRGHEERAKQQGKTVQLVPRQKGQ